MENRLISMVDFVLKQSNNENLEKHLCNENGHQFMNYWLSVFSYAKFLKQPLKLGMFVPCDENDVPINEPESRGVSPHYILGPTEEEALNYDNWLEAKDRVLFEGFALCDRNPNLPCLVLKKELVFDDIHFPIDRLLEYKIEDLVQHNLTLTASAIKQFEL